MEKPHMCLACAGLFWQVSAHVTGLSSVVVFLHIPLWSAREKLCLSSTDPAPLQGGSLA